MRTKPTLPAHPDVLAFYRAVAKAAPDHLVVEPAPDGFTVQYRDAIEVGGVVWHSDAWFAAKIVCDPASSLFTMEDREVQRGESVRGMGVRGSAFRGRMNARRSVATYEVLDDGGVGATSQQRQSTAEIHDLVRGVAAKLPWVEMEPTSALIGKYVAIATVGLMVLAGIAVAVMALTGALG